MLKYSPSLGLCHRRQNSDHHCSYFNIGSDPVVNEPDGHTVGIESLYQLYHIGSVAAKKFEQNDMNR